MAPRPGNRGESSRGLERYREKRSASRTPEPFGASAAHRPRMFVVQKHAARRLHYDFRLEWQGVLLSWAIPRGPCPDPSVKRLAVHVEDHPVDYADFEGQIPEGNYGAGAVILWDRGRWTPVEAVDEGLESGKLLFDLDGYKLRGRWTLVRTRRAGQEPGNEWLLIKKEDAFSSEVANEDDMAYPEGSVLSGLTLEALREGETPEAAALDQLEAWNAPRRRVDPARVAPMLAERAEAPFSGPDWLFEIKYDGYRLRAAAQGGKAKLLTRNGKDATATYPEIAAAVAALPFESLALDGEVAVLDAHGRPSFGRLQERAQLRKRRDVERATVELPVTYFTFDLIAFGDYDLRPLPLEKRKALLSTLLPECGPLRYSRHWEERGEDVFAQVKRLGFEGIVAKKSQSPYRSKRSSEWKKIRIRRNDDFVVVGFTAASGSRAGFGSLLLGAWRDGELVYAGRVGSGFSARQLADIRDDLDASIREEPPCAGAPTAADHTWVEPLRVCQVEYTEVTREEQLRQPVFQGFRDDKAPEDCEFPVEALARDDEPEPIPEALEEDEREVPFTNLDKVFWPADGTTKGDLIEYYRSVSEWLLPYLRDRPLVLTRYPDGIEGKSFYQKDAPTWVPDWVRRETVWSEHADREIHYFVCDDVESLLYVVNMGTIPLHVWSSRVESLPHPDWCILDLDPKGAPFPHVVEAARAIRELCEEMELPSFPKTSGSSGLHVLLPLGRQLTFDQSRTLGELMARVIVARLPEITTIARNLRSRGGKVYVDYLQNRHGQLLVAPFSVRPLPGGPVSMPLRWEEVTVKNSNERFTMKNAVRRMKRLSEEPTRPVLDAEPDLAQALARLRELF